MSHATNARTQAYGSENVGKKARIGMSADEVAAYRADNLDSSNLDSSNHYNVAKMRDDAEQDFKKVLPHEA